MNNLLNGVAHSDYEEDVTQSTTKICKKTELRIDSIVAHHKTARKATRKSVYKRNKETSEAGA